MTHFLHLPMSVMTPSWKWSIDSGSDLRIQPLPKAHQLVVLSLTHSLCEHCVVKPSNAPHATQGVAPHRVEGDVYKSKVSL